MSLSLEATRRRLQEQDETGYSAYEHISEILLKLVSEQPQNALELFEHLSATIKGSRPSDATPSADNSAEDEAQQARADWAEKTLRLVTGDQDPETGEFIAAPEDAEDKIEDVLHVADDLEDAGVGIGEEERVRVKQAMVRLLGQHEEIEKLRFFGKVLGTSGDYYVLEATQDSVLTEEEETDSSFEPAANRFVYYVSNAVQEDFVRLPNVSAVHVAASMRIRTFLSGDANAAVSAHPPFPGTEAHLLRAIVARISGETTVAPQYFYSPGEVDDEAGEVPQEVVESEQMEDEEFVPPSLADIAAGGVARFRTYVPAHNENGFIGVPQIPDPQDPENSIPDPAAPRPQPAIRELSQTEWIVQRANNNVALRSLVWPGLTTLASQKSTVRIYMGYGIRDDPPGALQWAPQFPAPIEDEVDDEQIEEQADNTDKPVEPEPEGEGEENAEDGEGEDE